MSARALPTWGRKAETLSKVSGSLWLALLLVGLVVRYVVESSLPSVLASVLSVATFAALLICIGSGAAWAVAQLRAGYEEPRSRR